MKLTIKGIEIKEVESWKIDTIELALEKAREEFRLTQSESAALECERLYKIQKKFKEWTTPVKEKE